MASNKVDLASQALLLLGAETISAFNDGSAEGKVVSALYETTINGLLARQYWRFATKTAQLSQLATDPPDHLYDYAYSLPSDCLMVQGMSETYYGAASFTGWYTQSKDLQRPRYQIQGREVWSDISPLWIDYTFRPAEVDWPVYFDECVVHQLAADLAMPITENEKVAELWEIKARKTRAIAQVRDQSQQPGREIGTLDFIIPRF